jgi:hypothetical protein
VHQLLFIAPGQQLVFRLHYFSKLLVFIHKYSQSEVLNSLVIREQQNIFWPFCYLSYKNSPEQLEPAYFAFRNAAPEKGGHNSAFATIRGTSFVFTALKINISPVRTSQG